MLRARFRRKLVAWLREALHVAQHVDLHVTINISGAADPEETAAATVDAIRASFVKALPS